MLIDLSAVPDIEYSALLMLSNAEEKLQEKGIQMQLTSLNPRVLSTIMRSELGKKWVKIECFLPLRKPSMHI